MSALPIFRTPWFAAVAILAIGAIAGGVSAAQDEDAAVELSVGDTAPDFKLAGSDDKEYTLSEFKGKTPVILAFFPKAFTPG